MKGIIDTRNKLLPGTVLSTCIKRKVLPALKNDGWQCVVALQNNKVLIFILACKVYFRTKFLGINLKNHI